LLVHVISRLNKPTSIIVATGPVERPMVQMPAKNASGRLPSKANQTGGRDPSGKTSFSVHDVKAPRIGFRRLASVANEARRRCGRS
jgi:hypothetical protein